MQAWLQIIKIFIIFYASFILIHEQYFAGLPYFVNFGINAGAGFEMNFGKLVCGLIDIKYVISEIDQVVVRMGIGIKLAPEKTRNIESGTLNPEHQKSND